MLPTITMVGRLVADPEMRFTRNGDAVANFTVATNERIRRGDTWEDGDACFVDCTAWRNLAETVGDQLHKGSLVSVGGLLRQETWTDKNGGKRSRHRVHAQSISQPLTGGRRSTEANSGRGDVSRQADPWGATDEQEAPF